MKLSPIYPHIKSNPNNPLKTHQIRIFITGSSPVGTTSLIPEFPYFFPKKTAHFLYPQFIPKLTESDRRSPACWIPCRLTKTLNLLEPGKDKPVARGRSAAVTHRTWQPGAFRISASLSVGTPGGLLPWGFVFCVRATDTRGE